MDVGARLEQDFERFADLFVGLVAAAGRVVGVPHAARIISGVTWYALGSSTTRDVLNRITNGSSRPAIRPRPHQGRPALKRSVALTLILLSGSSLAASTLPVRDERQRCLYFGMGRIRIGSGPSRLNRPRWWRGCDIMNELPHIAG